MLYYHFLKTKDAIDDLINKRIKVSTLDSLNDPFELKPYLAFKARGRYNQVREEINKKCGLLCFSEDWRESLLWGHYADKHRGIALGFEINENIKKVEYVLEREKIELTKDEANNEKLFLDKLAYKKYKNWEYEKEYRMWIKLEDCKKEDKGFYFEFNNNLVIKKIILGCKFNLEENIDTIGELAKKYGIQIIPTREEWGWFRINECGKKRGFLKQKNLPTYLDSPH